MIKCEKDGVEVEGKLLDVLAEYVVITAALKDAVPPEFRGILTKAHESGMRLEGGSEKQAAEYFIGGMLDAVKDINEKKTTYVFKMD